MLSNLLGRIAVMAVMVGVIVVKYCHFFFTITEINQIGKEREHFEWLILERICLSLF